MNHDIKDFVAACPIYSRNKSSNQPPTGQLQLLHTPSRPWSHISLDFVTGLPLSEGSTVILTIINRFSKADHFDALSKLPLAFETTQLIV